MRGSGRMKNTSTSVHGGHRPAALEPGSTSYRADSAALASFGRAGTGGLCSSPARGRRRSPSVRGPAHARRLVLRLQEGRLRGPQTQTDGPTAANPAVSPPHNSSGSWNRFVPFPGVPVKLLYRQWKQADATLPALSAIYRWLEQNDLDAQGRRYLLRQNIPGPTKAFRSARRQRSLDRRLLSRALS